VDIDRGLFLSLSAAIAASSCKSSSAPPYRPRPHVQVGYPAAPPAHPPGTHPPGTLPPSHPQGVVARTPHVGPPAPGMEGMPPPHREGMPAPHHEGAPAPAGADTAWRDECRRM